MMKYFIIIILFLFSGLTLTVNAQINPYPTQNQQQTVYKDRITDEYGNPLSGIRVSVRGKGIYTYSDLNGNFSIKARFGDEIVLSKDGKLINSYFLNNSNNYEVEDKSNTIENVREEKISKKKSSRSAIERNSYIDSAAFYSSKDPYKSIDFIERQLQSKKRQTKDDLIESYSLLGDNYVQLKQYDLAVSNYQTALNYTSDLELQIKLAKTLAKNHQYIISSVNYNRLLKESLSASQVVEVNEGLGDNANKQNHIDNAIIFYEKALEIAKTNKITSKIADLNAKIAELLAAEGKKSESNIYIQNTIQSSRSERFKKRAEVQNKVAGVYQSNKDYDSEIQTRKQTLEELEEAQIESIVINDENKTELSTSQLNLDIGRAYIDKNEYDKAIPYLEKSASKAGESDNLEVQKDAIQKLSELYKKIGNSKKALENYQEYARIVNILYQQKENEIKAAITLSNELRDKQNRINSLEKDRELSESRHELSLTEQELTTANYRRQKMLIYGLIVGLLLLGAIVFYMYRSNKERRMANNLLALKNLRSQMNPHFIFNALNSVNSFIAQNDERTANKYLTDFSTLMRNVLDNSEKDFIPLSDELELLNLYIQLEHSRFKDKFDYNISVDENIQKDDFLIPPMLLQPYVENAVWHGLRYKKGKGKLEIDVLQEDSETIHISIIDDGIGRKRSKELKTQNQKKQQSKGMSNINNRIDILNEMYQNKVSIQISDLKKDGSGTKVVLSLKKK